MRGFNVWWTEIHNYRNHEDIIRLTKDLRMALNELDIHQQYNILINTCFMIDINNVLKFICYDPESIEYVDAITCVLSVSIGRFVLPRYADTILSKFPKILQDTDIILYCHPLLGTPVCKIDVMRVFIHHGIDINLPNTYGQTPLGIMISRVHDVKGKFIHIGKCNSK